MVTINWGYFLAGLAAMSLFGCTDGYKKIDGQWRYVTTDEYRGTVHNKLGADDNSLTVLRDGYAKDKHRVFCNGKVIEGADPDTFEPMSGTAYSKDKAHVYVSTLDKMAAVCEIIPGADPRSFKIIQAPYSRDQNRAFCGSVPMNVANLNDFQVVQVSEMWNTFYDKGSFLLEYGREFKDYNVSKNHLAITGNGAWARDGRYYYFGPARVVDADYATFKVSDSFNASDKDRKYMFSFPADQIKDRRKLYMGID